MGLFRTNDLAQSAICTVSKDTDVSGLEEMEDSRLTLTYRRRHYAMIRAIADVGLPAKGEQYRLVTRRKFNACDVVGHIAETEGIDHMACAIYSLNHEAAKMIVRLLDEGKIRTAEICISDLRNKAHRQKEELTQSMFAEHPGISLWYCSSHAKVTAMQTKQGNHYVLEGSGNMSFNSRVEQYVIDNDEEIYRWVVKWMQEMKLFLAGKTELMICGQSKNPSPPSSSAATK